MMTDHIRYKIYRLFDFGSLNIKFFQSIQSNFAILGIKPSQQCQKSLFNTANSSALAILVHFSVATTAFLLYYANNFKELADSFCTASTATAATLNFIILICNSTKVYKLIENCESAVQKSKIFFLICEYCRKIN